jgi:hypothetical protein
MHTFPQTDTLETFFVNSYQNGATSWIPKDIPENVKIVMSITKGTCLFVKLMSLSTYILFIGDRRLSTGSSEVDTFIRCHPESNVLELGELGNALAEEVIKICLKKSNRHLTSPQVYIY